MLKDTILKFYNEMCEEFLYLPVYVTLGEFHDTIMQSFESLEPVEAFICNLQSEIDSFVSKYRDVYISEQLENLKI